MSQEQDIDVPDIYTLEIQLQEKINELQWKSKTLEESQRELLQVRQELFNKEIIIEDTKRTVNDLKIQLATAHEVIEMIEKEKAKYLNEKLQLQINCDTAMKERENLLEQTHAVKLENITLKLNVQKLSETINANEFTKKTLEFSLSEMQERFSQANNFFQSNVDKLEKEHQCLLKSIESTVQLNKRLQTVGLCTHAIYTKKDEEIRNLRQELILNKQTNISHQKNNFNEIISRHKRNKYNSAILEQIRIDIEKDKEADKEIEAIITEFENS